MDIQEIKTWAKNKIESDDLAKQVRRRIKETTWEEQISNRMRKRKRNLENHLQVKREKNHKANKIRSS